MCVGVSVRERVWERESVGESVCGRENVDG